MGHQHIYPFVLAEPALEKLKLVHGIVQQAADLSQSVSAPDASTRG
jgi:hypothetical protein